MQDVRSYQGYDREYSEAQMSAGDFVRANYYGGDMDVEAIIAHINDMVPEARIMERYLDGESTESLMGAALSM